MKKFIERTMWAGLFLIGASSAMAAPEPAWWSNVKNGLPPSDFSIANQGQAKWFAAKAEEEFRARLWDPYNGPIVVPPLQPGNDFTPINQGQLKTLVKPFYDRIYLVAPAPTNCPTKVFPPGMLGHYPWTDTTTDDQSYAPVTIGQLKNVFNLDFDRLLDVVVIEATDTTGSEATLDTGTFTITRTTCDLTHALQVNFLLTGTATEGNDYFTIGAIGAQVIIPIGELTATVTVQPVPDALVEGTETVIATLQPGANYTIGDPNVATVNILDGPVVTTIVTVETTDSDAAEAGPNLGTFTLHRTGGSLAAALPVKIQLSGTATEGADYQTIGTEVTIPAGESSLPVNVQPLADILGEGTETAILTVKVGAGYLVGNPSADTVFIRDVGFLINLRSTPQGYLEINPVEDTAPLPFVNVADSARGTIARIQVVPTSDPALPATWSKVVGEYYTAPTGRGRNPSRTSVDRYGNMWVGNRDEVDSNGGSIVEIGVVIGGTRCTVDGTPNINGDYLKPPFQYNTCIDRDKDGLIHTSKGLGSAIGWSSVSLPAGDGDEAVRHYVRTFATGVRSLPVDKFNNLWVGSRPNEAGTGAGWQEYIDTSTGLQVTGRRFSFGGGGYGGVIDGQGTLWSASYLATPNASLLRFIPGGASPSGVAGGIIAGTGPSISGGTGDGYGIGVDPLSGDIWLGDYDHSGFFRFKNTGCFEKVPIPGGGNIKGVVVDGHGNVWAAQATGDAIYRLTTAGAYVGKVTLNHPTLAGVKGKFPFGVSIDPQGRVWAVCADLSSNLKYYAMRIDPTHGLDPQTGLIAGTVVEAVDLGSGAGPYLYSDMTGYVTLGTTQPAGVLDVVQDSGSADMLWTTLALDADLNSGSVITEVRAANMVTELTSWPFRTVTAGALPAGIKGRYVELRVSLLRNFGSTQSPVLKSYAVQSGSPGTALQITSHPVNQIAVPGQNSVSFSVSAIPPGGATIAYKWKKDGLDISSATLDTLTLNNVQATDAAKYSVHVTDSTGGILDSAEARLHVKGNAPVLTQNPTISPAAPNPGNTVTITAKATATSAATAPAVDDGYIPIYYQWRVGQVPIGSSGQCSMVGNVGTTTLTIPNVQCANVGVYSVVFWNAYGEILSAGGNLTVAGSPASVTITPATQNVTAPNQTVTLTANVSCINLICGQWYMTTVCGVRRKLPGATSTTYTLPTPITADQIGTYAFDAFDSAWKLYEATATVTANGATVGMSSVTFTLNPTTGTGWTYQWFYQPYAGAEAAINGAQTASHTIALGGAATGYYRVAATGNGGATAGVRMELKDSSGTPIVWGTDAQNGTVDLMYTVGTPNGIGPWTGYQWYKNNLSTPIPQAISDSLLISGIDCTELATYLCKVSNIGCLSVNASGSLGVASPSTVGMKSATFTLNPTTGSGWVYQWYYQPYAGSENPIGGPQSSSYTVTLNGSSAGYYRVAATGSGGATSGVRMELKDSSATPIVWANDAQNGTVDLMYTVGTPTGVGPWTAYQWYKNNLSTPIAQANTDHYLISAIDCTKLATYLCRVSNPCGTAPNSSGSLSFANPTAFGMQSATFTINPVNGTGWTYQWYYQPYAGSETPIGGANGASHTIPLTGSGTGYYRVAATGAGGATASVLMEVNNASSISALVLAKDAKNATIDFRYTTVTPSGVGPWTYQWYKGSFSSPINGANQNSLLLTGLDCTKAATYVCRVVNSCSTSASASGGLSVVVPTSVNLNSTTFTVSPITGSGWTYHWYYTPNVGAENEIVGANTPSLTVNLSGSSVVGHYRMAATGTAGATASALIQLSNGSATFPTAQAKDAQNATVNIGFTAESLNGVAWSYQWYYPDLSPIGGANGSTYTVAPLDCSKQGIYRLKLENVCAAPAVLANLSIANPFIAMKSMTLKLNPTTGGTLNYVCEEKTGGPGAVFQPFGPQVQSLIIPATPIGAKSGYEYRITAKQGSTVVAQVTAYLGSDYEGSPDLEVLDVQGGTSDVTYQGASPIGIGPWTYQWLKYNNVTGNYDPIPGELANQYTISAVNCTKSGIYRLQVSDGCANTATVNNSLFTGGPSVRVQSLTLKLNPTTGGTLNYVCEEKSTAGGAVFQTYGPQGQTLIMPTTSDGAKSTYQYRITAKQGSTVVAQVRVSFDSDLENLPALQVLDVQGGTADVIFKGATPTGVGPWTYEWLRQNLATGLYDTIPGEATDQYTLTAVDCIKAVGYQFRATDDCDNIAAVVGTITTAVPSVTLKSMTLKLNPTTGGTLNYVCEEKSTAGGAVFQTYGPQGQTLTMPTTSDSAKSGYYYRITAKQGSTVVAQVTAWLANDNEVTPNIQVLDVQGGTADVTYKGNSPVGVGPWTYQWGKYNPSIGDYDTIPGQITDQYTITAVDCTRQGTYRLRALDSCTGFGDVFELFSTGGPSAITLKSLTLKLNPTTGGTLNYVCEEKSTAGGAVFQTYGPQGQTLTMPTTSDSAKSGYYYRITAKQGSTIVAQVTAWLISDYEGSPNLQVVDVQDGTADLTYKGNSPVGVGPWTYQWGKYNPSTGDYDPISGQITDQYTIIALDCNNQGTYRLRALDSCTGLVDIFTALTYQGCP